MFRSFCFLLGSRNRRRPYPTPVSRTRIILRYQALRSCTAQRQPTDKRTHVRTHDTNYIIQYATLIIHYGYMWLIFQSWCVPGASFTQHHTGSTRTCSCFFCTHAESIPSHTQEDLMGSLHAKKRRAVTVTICLSTRLNDFVLE